MFSLQIGRFRWPVGNCGGMELRLRWEITMEGLELRLRWEVKFRKSIVQA